MEFTYDLNETRATDCRPYNVFFIFRRGDSRIARFVCDMRLFFRSGGSKPRPTVQNLHTINFLSDQGLGGPWELARAKARLHLAPTVYPYVWDFLLEFMLRRFWEGVRGNAFSREKGSPAILLIYLSSQTDNHCL